VLALVGDGLRKDSPLAKALAKKGDVLVYEVTKRDLPKWVGEQFGRHGVKASAEACRALVELVGDNLQELASEVEKLSVWAGHDEIGPGEVELLVVARADVPPFVLTDAWGRRDVGAVLSACESILERSGRSGEVHMLVGRVAAHVRRVLSCQNLDQAGVRPREAAAELKMHPFAAEKAFAQSRNFSVEELREAIVRLADLDLALKGGSRLPSELELQRTLVAITQASEPR
jgi:DNA polymerase III subunit delta